MLNTFLFFCVEIYSGVICALEKGVNSINSDTPEVGVMIANMLSNSDMLLDGDLFNNIQKENIKNLVKEYKPFLHPGFKFRYECSQLLLAIPHNIPNNSLSILWSNANEWTPLIERRN
jgi:hypothetical protein